MSIHDLIILSAICLGMGFFTGFFIFGIITHMSIQMYFPDYNAIQIIRRWIREKSNE